MFTGIIQQIGELIALGGMTGASIRVRCSGWEDEIQIGESVAVQGVCLTVAETDGDTFRADMLEESLRRSNLGAKRAGDSLNLERSLRAGDRFGGHLVTGHVDTVGCVDRLRREGRDWVLGIACGPEAAGGIVQKGSVACDGVSLTVTSVAEARFEVHVIPFTWTHTTLHALRAGASVNIELDIVGKYARRSGQPPGGGSVAEGQVTRESLERAGFDVSAISGLDALT